MGRAALAWCCVLGVLAACSVAPVQFTPGDPEPDGGIAQPGTATVSVTRGGAASGTISADGLGVSCAETCTATVTVGTVITLVATPDTGAVFGGWSGGGCGTDATCQITVTRDVAIEARFDVATFSVGVELLGSGTVTASGIGLSCPGTCSVRVPYDTAVTLVAEPTATSTFLGWTGACTDRGRCAFTVTADMAVTAAFGANQELSIVREGNGAGTVRSEPAGIDCGSTCTRRFPPGETVTLTATPAADSSFAGWTGGGCPATGTTCQVTVLAAVMVRAKFVLQTRTLQVTRNGTGSGTVSFNPAGAACGADCRTYDAHTPVMLTAAADAISTFSGWSGGCTGTGPCMVTMDDNVAVTATFARRTFQLSVGLAGTGSGVVRSDLGGIDCPGACAATYDANTVVTLTATPAFSSVFTGWSACAGTGPCEVTMSAARSVTATFAAHDGGLFTITDEGGRFQRFDPATRALTDIGLLNIPYAFGDCAWNPADATMYIVGGRPSPKLYRVSLTTGAAIEVGPHGVVDMFALGYHPPTNKLYGVGGDRRLYQLSTATGAATLVAQLATPQNLFVEGLVWDSKRNMMVAITSGAVELFSVNVSTGQVASLGVRGGLNDLGMTYDPGLDRFWVLDLNGRVVQIDPNAGYARADLGTTTGRHTCVAFVPNAN